MIRSVEIENFRGILEGSLSDLISLSVLVGPNGCGKSTVLDAIHIAVAPHTATAIARCVGRHSGAKPNARMLQSRGGDSVLIIVQACEGGSRDCGIWAHADSGELLVEFCTFHNDDDIQPFGAVRFHSDGNISLTEPKKRFFGNIQEVHLIEPSTSYLQASLLELYSRAIGKQHVEYVAAELSSLLENLENFDVVDEGNGKELHLVFANHSIPASLLSDGIYALLRLSLELIPEPCGLFLLEDPDLHLHPAGIHVLSRLTYDAVRKGSQIVLTTHSLDLIDALLTEAANDEELERMSVFRLKLSDGQLYSSRFDGLEAAMARNEIGDDLR